MLNAIIIAVLAGLASSLLAAAAASGAGVGLVFALIAPLPLMIVAIGWNPLLAVLGGALTSAALIVLFRGSTGVVFAFLVTAPSYLAGLAIWRSSASHSDETSPFFQPSNLVGLMCLGAAFYAALVTLVGALSISFDYATLQGHLLRQSELVYRFMMRLAIDAPLPQVAGKDAQGFINAYAEAVAPLTTAMLALIYMVNVWLASKIVMKSNHLPINWQPVSNMSLPKFILPFLVATLLGGMLPGYLGFTLELMGVAGVMAVSALGYAAVHDATIGNSARGIILTVLWTLTLIFGLPALIMLMVGIAELAFGWREKVIARRKFH
jgi:hypothetical protein